MDVTTGSLALVVITLLAATVNGALGYGFSSITVPVALLFYTNRVLNPALVWVEVALNTYVLWVNRASIPHVWRRVVPMILGLAPGVALGAAQARDVHRPAAPDSAAGSRFSQTHQGRAPPRAGLRRRPRRAVLGHDDLRPAAGGDVEQPGLHETGLPSRPRTGAARGVELHGRGLLLRRHVLHRERRPASLHPPESRGRDPAGRTGHTARATRDLQARLHELRRLGRGLWHLDTTATATPHRDQRRVLRPGRGGPDRHLAAVPLLPASDARARRGGSPAGPGDSVEVREGHGDRDLVLLPAERRQRGPVVPELGPKHGARPRLDVQRRRAAAELVPRPSACREAERGVGTGTVLVIHVVAPQRQTDGGAQVVGNPAAEGPPLRILRRIGQRCVRLLRAVV